ncbi:hypothetical protein V8U11_10895 [Pseudomonas chlororaphis]|uniref:phage nozzle protein n=1 Tax=Pseudomonas chlororaphis TaxID=587753 RepID=UPI0030CEB930
MPLISQSIKSLKGGISQQPNNLRFPDQGEIQENGFSSEVEGLQKRPPTVHLKRIMGTFPGNPAFHLIHRDAVERYMVMTDNKTLRVWDLAGNEITVNSPEGLTYLATTNPREDLRLVTVADYTFVVNRKVVVKAATERWPVRPNEAFLWVKTGQYGKSYKITITFSNGTVQYLTFTTPDGTDAKDSPKVAANYIRDQFLDQALNGTSTVIAGIPSRGPTYLVPTATENGGLYLTPKAGYSISKVAIEDGFNGQSIMGFMQNAQRFNQLPPQCLDGYVVKVAGDPDSEADDYFLQYSETQRLWRECAEPGSLKGFDKTTMPHVMIREANGTFTFRTNEWGQRMAGDDDTNPFPSFVDAVINDVFFFRNRIGFISGENAVMSVGGEFFKFFPPSVVVLADTDPIDVSASGPRVSILYNAVPFKEELLLFSSEVQFNLRAEGILSVKTAKIDLTTEYDCIASVRPVGVGRSVFFASERALFSSMNRFYAVQDVSDVKDAEDITAHVPSFIPNGIFKMSSSNAENLLVVPTSGQEDTLFVYKFLFQQDQLVQQSWSHWTFKGDRVLAAEFVGSELYLVLSNPSGTYLEKLSFTQNTLDFQEEPYRLYMDRKVRYEVPQVAAYDEYTGITSINLSTIYGVAPDPTHKYHVVAQDGRVWTFDGVPGGVLEIPRDVRGEVLIIGKAFAFRYQFSQFLLKKTDQQGLSSEDVGRLQLRYGWINYKDAGPFTITVKVGNRKPFTYVQTSRVLGGNKNRLGVLPLETGKKTYPIQSQPEKVEITVSSDDVSPLALTGAGWEALYSRRNQGV